MHVSGGEMTRINRIGRRTILAMLLIVAVVIVWTVMGGR
jgi:hypothetical protein